MRWPPAFEADIPNLLRYGYTIRSEASGQYNCIAWAVGETRRWWWPLMDAPGGHYWPEGVAVEETIEAFLQAFASAGFVECDSPDLEEGFEKIALYVDSSGTPAHAARQLPSGMWTSKIGYQEDIEHGALEAVECDDYGQPARFMKRPRSAGEQATADAQASQGPPD